VARQISIQIVAPVWLLQDLQNRAALELSSVSTIGRRALVKGLGLEIGRRDDSDRAAGANL
jgi:hypothetical protein